MESRTRGQLAGRVRRPISVRNWSPVVIWLQNAKAFPRVCEGGELARRPKVSSNETVPYSPYAKHYGPWILIKVVDTHSVKVLVQVRYPFEIAARSSRWPDLLFKELWP